MLPKQTQFVASREISSPNKKRGRGHKIGLFPRDILEKRCMNRSGRCQKGTYPIFWKALGSPLINSFRARRGGLLHYLSTHVVTFAERSIKSSGDNQPICRHIQFAWCRVRFRGLEWDKNARGLTNDTRNVCEFLPPWQSRITESGRKTESREKYKLANRKHNFRPQIPLIFSSCDPADPAIHLDPDPNHSNDCVPDEMVIE